MRGGPTRARRLHGFLRGLLVPTLLLLALFFAAILLAIWLGGDGMLPFEYEGFD